MDFSLMWRNGVDYSVGRWNDGIFVSPPSYRANIGCYLKMMERLERRVMLSSAAGNDPLSPISRQFHCDLIAIDWI